MTAKDVSCPAETDWTSYVIISHRDAPDRVWARSPFRRVPLWPGVVFGVRSCPSQAALAGSSRSSAPLRLSSALTHAPILHLRGKATWASTPHYRFFFSLLLSFAFLLCASSSPLVLPSSILSSSSFFSVPFYLLSSGHLSFPSLLFLGSSLLLYFSPLRLLPAISTMWYFSRGLNGSIFCDTPSNRSVLPKI